jgi:hypothetical protein
VISAITACLRELSGESGVDPEAQRFGPVSRSPFAARGVLLPESTINSEADNMLTRKAAALAAVALLMPAVPLGSESWATQPTKPIVAAAARLNPPRPAPPPSRVDPRFGTKPVLWNQPPQTMYDPRPARPDPNFGKKPVLWKPPFH